MALPFDQTNPRLFYGWWIVAFVVCCLLFSEPTVSVFAFGVFLKAVSADLHVGRGAVSFGFTIHNLGTAAISPFIGRLIDRFGVRRVALPASLLIGIVIISAKWIGSSVWQYYVFYLALGLIGTGAGVVAYGAIVARWFDRYRGLALGLTGFGTGIAAMIYPPVAQRLIALYGWRSAYALLGIAILVIPFFVLWLFIKEDPAQMGLYPDGVAPSFPQKRVKRNLPGLTWSEIWPTRIFWLFVFAFFLAGASVHACVLHFAALLSDRGASAQAAANAVSIVGIAMLFGRTGSGYFLDRFFAPRVCLVIFGQSALGIAILASGASGPVGILAGFLVGLAFGAEVEVIAYLVSRYFGLRSFATAYGVCFSSFVLAGAVGTYVMGAVFDGTRSYTTPLILFFVLMLVAALLFTRLGPYRFAVGTVPDTTSLPVVSEAAS